MAADADGVEADAILPELRRDVGHDAAKCKWAQRLHVPQTAQCVMQLARRGLQYLAGAVEPPNAPNNCVDMFARPDRPAAGVGDVADTASGSTARKGDDVGAVDRGHRAPGEGGEGGAAPHREASVRRRAISSRRATRAGVSISSYCRTALAGT